MQCILSLFFTVADGMPRKTLSVTTLLTGCAGESSTPTTPLGFPQSPSPGSTLRSRRGKWRHLEGHNENSTVTVHAPGAGGNVAPIATIGGGSAGINYPDGLALDASGNIYLTYFFNTTVYANGATGNVAPMRTIAGTRTKLYDPFEVAVDSGSNNT